MGVSPELLKSDIAANMTKREAFAMAAMQGLTSSGIIGEHYRTVECAKLAVQFADALLAELTNPRG